MKCNRKPTYKVGDKVKVPYKVGDKVKINLLSTSVVGIIVGFNDEPSYFPYLVEINAVTSSINIKIPCPIKENEIIGLVDEMSP